MIKPANIIITIVLSVCVWGLFHIKYKVQDLGRDIKEMRRQLAHEKQSIHVLKAEWAYLNQPERLTKLAKKYLDVGVIKFTQMRKITGKKIFDSKIRSKYIQNVSIAPRKKIRWNFKDKNYSPMNKTGKHLISHISNMR